jgi:SAM-dependent methyltransferase
MPDRTVVPPYSALAAGYDVVMAHVDYQVWAEFIYGLLMRHAPGARDVLELGCGTGSFALVLQELGGFRYLATDRSEEMLRVARAKAELEGAPVQFETADFTDFRTDAPVDVVVLLYDGINYLIEIEDVRNVIRCAHAALRPGGVFVFDVSTPANSENNTAYFQDEGSDSEFSYVRTSRYDRDRRLHVTRFELNVQGVYSSEEHVQRAYGMPEIGDLLEPAAWQEVHAYDAFSTAPAHEGTERIHWVLKKAT